MIFVNRTSYIVPNGRMTANSKMERMWKEAIVDSLEAYSEDLLEGIEEK
jgi:hypothetical protein